jgi:hypothetical protein
MHFLFNLLRIKGIYTFRTLLAHPQEAPNKREDWNGTDISETSSTPILVQPTIIPRTKNIKCCLCFASWGWASNARNMYRPLILNKLNKKCITFASLYLYIYIYIYIYIWCCWRVTKTANFTQMGTCPREIQGKWGKQSVFNGPRQSWDMSLSHYVQFVEMQQHSRWTSCLCHLHIMVSFVTLKMEAASYFEALAHLCPGT